MWAIGTYERFLRKIKGQENYGEKVNFFGVLFCDVRQSKAKEYILNYLDVFNNRSCNYIDFYIPGYIPEKELYNSVSSTSNEIYISNSKYIFDQKKYTDFCTSFQNDFDVNFPFSATLVLMEYIKGNFSTAKKIIFELEDTDKGVKSAGPLFLQIFNCAEKGNMAITIEQLSKKLSAKDKANMLAEGANEILNFFGIDLKPIVNQYQIIQRYKVISH